MKPDCYQCIHRRPLPGNCHSSCAHPSLGDQIDVMMNMVHMMLGNNLHKPKDLIKVVGDPHAIKSGYFLHPFDFDPIWLESCTGFEEKKNV